ncbi:uncharacterized protein MICPUCDRAFT_48382, partial [Micromonas pusilla CCMP1545]
VATAVVVAATAAVAVRPHPQRRAVRRERRPNGSERPLPPRARATARVHEGVGARVQSARESREGRERHAGRHARARRVDVAATARGGAGPGRGAPSRGGGGRARGDRGRRRRRAGAGVVRSRERAVARVRRDALAIARDEERFANSLRRRRVVVVVVVVAQVDDVRGRRRHSVLPRRGRERPRASLRGLGHERADIPRPADIRRRRDRRDGDDRRRRATQRRRERVDPAQPAPLPHERAAARRRRDVRDAPRGGQHRARPLSYVLEPSLPQVRAAVHPRHDHGVPDRSSRVELRADRRAAARLAVVVEPAVDLRRRRSLALLRGGSRFRRRRRRRDRRGTPPRAHGVIGVLHRDVSLHVRDGRARDRSGEARVREVRDEDAAAVHDRRAVEDRQRAGATGQRGRLAAV